MHTSRHDEPVSSTSNIFAAIELSSTSWVIALHIPGRPKISFARVASGDAEALLNTLRGAQARAACAGADKPQVHSCYEAGYDGFWLHRFLVAEGIHNQVLDSASIQVSRRRRNAKTDRIDAEALVRVLMALQRGEAKVCSVVRVPTPEQEDAKRLHRSRENLVRERVRHVNRIKALLKLQGIFGVEPLRDGWLGSLSDLKTRDGRLFPVHLMREIRREAKLLEAVRKMLREVVAEIDALVGSVSGRVRKPKGSAASHAVAESLMRIRGIGPTFASVLATEVFYRKFGNRRAVASYVGLTPTPYSSGGSSRDQGISKAGNACARHYAVELAWLWLRNQPTSRLAAWFNERVAALKGRTRRVAIVAPARKLMIALWRFVETGLVPDGAALKG
ncbi:IS110 family transposase [Enterovirga sp. CN4-39]|uniref:IS110 family transposase n=1 Tax=Enterovirga sp. CN4-39 TaxID=3400910 RepID=UPI003C0AF8B3